MRFSCLLNRKFCVRQNAARVMSGPIVWFSMGDMCYRRFVEAALNSSETVKQDQHLELTQEQHQIARRKLETTLTRLTW